MRFPLVACVLAVCAATLPAHATTTVSKEAQDHFTAGVSFLQDPDGARYEEAYREFKAAYAASPSWKILGNLGIAAFKLERDGEAIEAFRKYASEGGDELDAEERAQVQRDLSTLQASVATLTFEVPAGARVLDERFPATGSPIRNSYGPAAGSLVIGVRPGRHRFTLSVDGQPDSHWEVELQPAEKKSHAFERNAGAAPARDAGVGAKASAPSGNGMRVASYVALGVGAVGLGVGTVFAVRARAKYQDGNDLCPATGTCTLSRDAAERRASFGDAGDRAKTASIAAFVVGGLGVVGGVTLLVLSGGSKEKEAAETSAYVGLNEVGFRGTF